MKKNIVWASSALAIMLVVAMARTQGGPFDTAQGRPDFTGTWVVETVERPERPSGGPEGSGRGSRVGGGRRGGGGPAEPPDGGRGGAMALLQVGQRVRIRQSPERLIVTMPSESGEQVNAYALDGSESSNASGRGSVKSKTKWEGAALVTESTQKIEGPMREVTLKTREVRSLSDDGRTMTLRTTVDTPRGEMTSTATFVKAEE